LTFEPGVSLRFTPGFMLSPAPQAKTLRDLPYDFGGGSLQRHFGSSSLQGLEHSTGPFGPLTCVWSDEAGVN
jgi:hypothetical protein